MFYYVMMYLGMASPKRLPVVIVGHRRYFFDQKLAQLRCVDCPSDYIDLSEFEVGALNFRFVASELNPSG